MPFAVQEIGSDEDPFVLTTWDQRDGRIVPIDIIEFKGLKSESGEIRRNKNVEHSSTMTSMTDQTYTFSMKLTHKVPINGYFSFLLSKNYANGVKISSAEIVENNCYLIRAGSEVSLTCKTGLTEDGRTYVNATCSRDIFGSYGDEEWKQPFEFRI